MSVKEKSKGTVCISEAADNSDLIQHDSSFKKTMLSVLHYIVEMQYTFDFYVFKWSIQTHTVILTYNM